MARSLADKKSVFDGRKMWFFFAALAAVVTAGVIFTLLSAVAATSTYWVIKSDVTVQPHQAITSDMLEPVSVPKSAAPKNLITISEVKAAEGGDAADDYYAKYTLTSGDIITTSNAGPLVDFGSDLQLEEGMVFASFKANPSLATGGNVKQGSLVDVAVIYDEGGVYSSKFFLSGVTVVQATVDLDSASASATGEKTSTSTSTAGAPVLYTLALTPQQAAALAVATKYDIYVVLTGTVGNVNDIQSSLSDIINDMGSTSFEITDPIVVADETKPSATPTPTPTAKK